MAKERKCLCCGNAYEYCPNCGKSSEPWKINFDTELCKELFNAVSGYYMGVIKEEGLLKIVNKYSINDYTKYTESIQNALAGLSGKKNNKIKEVEVVPVVEETPVIMETPIVEESSVATEEKTDEVTENVFTEDIPRNRRRNRFFE